MKIGFAGRWNPLNKTAWSGIYYHTYTEITKYYPVESFYYKWPWHVRERLLLHKQFQKLSNKKAAVEFLKGYGKYFGKQLEQDLLKRKVDVLFVPSAPQLIAYCNTSIPIIYLTDATFLQLQGYYPLFSEIANYNIQEGLKWIDWFFKKQPIACWHLIGQRNLPSTIIKFLPIKFPLCPLVQIWKRYLHPLH
jgi:hypothetical protein